MKAVRIGWQTTVGGFPRDPDSPGGTNCFNVKGDDGKWYNIVNFYVEDLDKLFKKGLVWPIECKVLGDGTAIFHDPRIGERWYRKGYCEVCRPKELLPCNQRDIHERDIMRGRRKEGSAIVDGREIGYYSIDGSVKAEVE